MKLILKRLTQVGVRNNPTWKDYENNIKELNKKFNSEDVSFELVQTSCDKGSLYIIIPDEDLNDLGIVAYLELLEKIDNIMI